MVWLRVNNFEIGTPEHAFFEACRNNDAAAITEIALQKPSVITAVDGMLRTGLHWAAVEGHHEAVVALARLPGLKPRLRDRKGWNATEYYMHWNAFIGNEKSDKHFFRLLNAVTFETNPEDIITPAERAQKAKQDKIDARDRISAIKDPLRRAFMLACLDEDVDAAKQIAAKRPSVVTTRDSIKRTALHNAAYFGSIAVVSALSRMPGLNAGARDQNRELATEVGIRADQDLFDMLMAICEPTYRKYTEDLLRNCAPDGEEARILRRQLETFQYGPIPAAKRSPS